MTPILFPYTFIDSDTMDRLNRYFESIAIFQPTSRFVPDVLSREAKRGRISIQVPVDNETERLSSQLRSHRSWGDFVGVNSMKGMGLKPEEIPFFDESATHRIHQDIQNIADGQMPVHKKGVDLFNSRLFLLLAQQFDEQSADIENQMNRATTLEAQMFQSLTGSPERSAGKSTPSDDRYGYLSFHLKARIIHWCRLACEAAVDEALWITPSRAAFDEWVGDRFAPVFVCRIEAGRHQGAPLLNPESQYHRRLKSLIHSPWSGHLDPEWFPDQESADEDDMTRLCIYLLPGVSTPRLMVQTLEIEDNTEDKGSAAEGHNSLIGVLER